MAYRDKSEDVLKRMTLARRAVRIVAILLVAAAVVGIAMYREPILARFSRIFGPAEADPIPVWSLDRSPLQLEVQANGEIVGLETVPIPTPSTRSGSLKLAWIIPEGTMVEAGTPVIRFDNTDTLLQLESQQNNVTRNLLDTAVMTGDQALSEKTTTIDQKTAEMDYEYTKQVQPEDETIFSRWEIVEAKLNADFARAKLENLAEKFRVQKRVARSRQQQQTINRNRSLQEISLINQTLAAMELKSPANGMLLYRRDRRQDPQVGNNVQAGQVVVEVIDLNALQARIYVLEKEAGSLERGKPVTIRLDALPDREFHGEIRSVSALAATLERNSPLKYFTCEVTIRDASKEDLRHIKPGMALLARVILEKYDSCFIVPASALEIKDSDPNVYVFIKRGDTGDATNDYEKRAIQIGMAKHGQATILSGVKEGELVALRNPFETRALKLPDFTKATNLNQQRRGGPGGQQDLMRMMQMQLDRGGGGGGGGMRGGGGGGGGGRGR
jgi:multidrug efflux pump subunit AcrA (membrane-fusion protein)